LLEVITDKAVDNIADKGSFEFQCFFLVRKCILNINILASEVEDLLYGQPTIERYVDGPDVI